MKKVENTNTAMFDTKIETSKLRKEPDLKVRLHFQINLK